ncbi:MAG: lipid export permease/ATP-binding protein MsbA, partial [Pseudomonadota bacterium]
MSESAAADTGLPESDKNNMPSFQARLKRIWPYFAESRWGLALGLAAGAVGAMTEPMIPALMKPLLDKGFQNGALPLWSIPLAIVGLFAVRGGSGFVAQYALSWFSNQGVARMRAALFARLLSAQPELYQHHTASSLTNTVVYEVQGGARTLTFSTQSLVTDSLRLLALLGYLFYLNWQLTLFVALLFPAVAVVMKVLSKRLRRLSVAGQDATDALAYVVEENVMAWRLVRLHGAQAPQTQRFDRHNLALTRISQKSVTAGASMTPITQMLAAMALSAVIVAALWQTDRGTGSVGAFVSFVTAMLMLVAPMKSLSQVADPITRGMASLDRGAQLIASSEVEHSGGFDPGRSGGRLELQGVTLRYRDDQPPAVDNITLLLEPGQSVALVGPSGAGKSTLVNLLPRFIEPTAGQLLLDGMPLAEWDIHALRRQFALVSQDVVLFNDSVAANVALGSELDPTRVRAALQAANLSDFVATLPQGIETVIGHNGGQLSGGQRQRMAIARAIYKDAPILILDEATSALDSESERSVQAALETLMRGRTSLVIAHRLSTIERADRIVAMEAGRIAEQGSHAE